MLRLMKVAGVVGVVVALAAGGGLVVVPTAFAAGTTPAAHADTGTISPDISLSAATPVVSGASVADAKAAGRPVIVKESLTATSAALVWPDGHRTAEIFSQPVRVRSGAAASGWTPIDATLGKAADGLRPKAAAADVVVGAGALDPSLVRLRTASGVIGYRWNGLLPAPRVTANEALYQDVLPGVDAQVLALPQGAKLNFLVRSQPKAPLVIRLPLDLAGLTVRSSPDAPGAFELVADDGRVVARAGQSLMTDSSGIDPETGDRRVESLVDATLSGSVDGPVIELRPDPAFFDRADLVYPVVIDPPLDMGAIVDTYVASDAPTTSYPNDTLKAGTNSTGNITRTLIALAADAGGSMGDAQNDIIDTADLYVRVYFVAGDCTGSGRTLRVYRNQSGINEAKTWSSQPTVEAEQYAGRLFDCTTGQKAFNTDSVAGGHDDLTELVQQWATGLPNYGVSIRAGSESFQDSRRHFDDSELTSRTPTSLSYLPPKLSIAYHTASAPTLNTTSGHPNGVWNGNATWTYAITPPSGADWSGHTVSSYDLSVDGVVHSWPINGSNVFAPGKHTVAARAIRNDGVVSAWTATQNIWVDTANPATASVTMVSHPNANFWYDRPDFSANWAAVSDTSPVTYEAVVTRSSTPPGAFVSNASVVNGQANFALNTIPPGVSYLHVGVRDSVATHPTTWTTKMFRSDVGGSQATAAAGPGSADLLTGALGLGETDAEVSAGAGSVSFGRSYSSRASGGDAGSPYGPGWVSSVEAAGSTPWASLIDDAVVATSTVETYVTLVGDDGSTVTFKGTPHYVGSTDTNRIYTEADGQFPELRLDYAGSGAARKFTLTDTTSGEVTTFTPLGGALPVAGDSYAASDYALPSGDHSRVAYSTIGTKQKPVRVAATPPKSLGAVDCLAVTPAAAGCRQLRIVYAPSNQTTPAPLGPYKDQVQQIELWANSVTTGAWGLVAVVAQFNYDATGHLREAWDPRITSGAASPSDEQDQLHVRRQRPDDDADAAGREPVELRLRLERHRRESRRGRHHRPPHQRQPQHPPGAADLEPRVQRPGHHQQHSADWRDDVPAQPRLRPVGHVVDLPKRRSCGHRTRIRPTTATCRRRRRRSSGRPRSRRPAAATRAPRSTTWTSAATR